MNRTERGLVAALTIALAGACATAPGSPRQAVACPEIAPGDDATWTQISIDGRMLPPERIVRGGPSRGDPPELSHLTVDSVFDMEFVFDPADVVARGFCPGVRGMAITTVAEAGRLGLRPPPPPLCVRPRDYPAVVVVGDTLRVRAGQIDLMRECDRPSPGEVRWRSSDDRILGIDSTGLVTGRQAGFAEAIAVYEEVEARLLITVRARQ